MNHYLAARYVDSFGRGSTKLSAVWHEDVDLRASLPLLIQEFQFEEFSFMTMAEIRTYLRDLTVPLPAPKPDFDAVRDKRMSELTPAQQDDALELWIRENVGWMGDYHQTKYEFLLKRLDEARAAAAALARPQDAGAEVLPGATEAEIMSVDMPSLLGGDYEAADTVPECVWVREHASFTHVNAPETWEYVLNLANDLADVPEKLVPVIEKARREHMAYIVFHQG
jgi:hypothetical protein